ncbi:uncharacterized protein LOC128556833 [Mercenaria mercenaria]|uniref:uncharacterized protein LOC128556833 n=1 Tax=Mercenaria mercenaria TaxID=6596 RepID=UPI00234F4BB8|nr:uncharacterized protein LOC128556833 [Mercenaria mercenaria]
MRPVLNRLASDVRLMQRLVCQQRMMGSYTSPSPLTLKERTSVNNADMDSLPSPSGNWATEYAQAQTKYNISLAVSISLFAAVAYYVSIYSIKCHVMFNLYPAKILK